MIEKRKKQLSISNHLDSADYVVEDVEEYDSRKKYSYRYKYSYMMLIIVILLGIYRYSMIHSEDIHSHKSFDSEFDHAIVASSMLNSNNSIIRVDTKDIQLYGHEDRSDSKITSKTTNVKATAEISSSNSSEISTSIVTLSELQAQVDAQVALVRSMKFDKHVVMEKDPEAKIEIKKLQQLLQRLIPMLYGPAPYVVEMKLLFPTSMADPTLPQEQSLLFELAPIELIPYSVYYFLNSIKNWKAGQFHRNAGHVLQAWVKLSPPNQSRVPLAFQEYHPGFPHKQYTLGYAGRPGGPEFYISTVDNSGNHGPGSQGSSHEADGCFGKVRPESIPIVKRMQKQPGRGNNGFINDQKDNIIIQIIRLISQKDNA